MAKVIDAILKLTDQFTPVLNQAQKSISQVSKQAERAGKQIGKMGKTIESTGISITTKVTTPLLAMGTMAINTANSFEDSMAKVSTIADTTVKPLSVLKKEIIELSNNTGVAFTELAEAQYQAISAGVETASSVKFVETAVKASKGGFTDTTTAIDGLTTVLNAYGLEADRVTDISDQMMLAQNFGKTTFGEMASSLGNVIPTAAQLSVTTEELFSSIATLTKQGIGTSEAITGLKAAFSNIIKPSTEAAKMADSLGLSFNSAHLESVGFAKFMEEIATATGGSTEKMGKLFGSTEALNTMLVLTGKGSEDFTNVLSQMGDSLGLTQQAYEATRTTSERFKAAINKAKNGIILFGETLRPQFENVINVIDDLGDALGRITPEQAQAITKFALMTATIGPVVFVFGKLVSTIGKGVQRFGKFGKAIKGIKTIKAALGLIFTPANTVVLVITTIALAAFLIIKYWKPIKAFFSGVFAKIKEGISAMGFDFDKVKEQLNMLKQHFVNAFNIMKDVFVAIWPYVSEFLSGMWLAIKSLFTGIITFISGSISGIVEIIGDLIQIINGIIDFVVGVFTLDWEKAWNGIKNIFCGVFNGIKDFFGGIINTITGTINSVIDTVKNGFKGAKASVDVAANVPSVPAYATGTNYFKGGIAQVHEKGGEILDLPTGTRIYPHDESVSKAYKDGAKSGQGFTIAKLADTIIVREDADIDKIANALYSKFKKQALNMA